MTVKFVHATVSGVANTLNTQCDYVIAALDDQGRVWEFVSGRWYQIPSPPPPPEEKP